MKKIFGILLVVAFVFSLAGVFLSGTSAEAEPGVTIELPTMEDAQVRSGYPDTSYPGSLAISAGEPFGLESFYCYWKFDLSGIDRSQIISATFKAYSAPVELGTYWWITGTADVYTVSDDSWDEDTVTWNTMPTMDSLLDSVVLNQGRNHWYEWSVTDGVKADSGDYFSLGMKAHDGSPICLCSFVSREGAVADFEGLEAYLVLDMPDAPPPEPDISVSPTPIDFGDVTVDSSSSAVTVTVSNTGEADLGIGTVDITGTDADQFSKQNDDCSDKTIGPSDSATLEVVFSPTSTGSKSATLEIPSNDPDPDESLVIVPLSGNGAPVAPPPTNGGSTNGGSSGGGFGGGGGGGGATALCYLIVDMLGEKTIVKMGCCSNRALASYLAFDPDDEHFLEIKQGMEITCGDCEGCYCYPRVIVMSLSEGTPPLPDGMAIVGSIYDFTGYKDLACTMPCQIATHFDPPVIMQISYDPTDLPEGAFEPVIGFYDDAQGEWVTLPPDTGRVAEVGKLTVVTDYIASPFAVLVNVPPPALALAPAPSPSPPPPAPAHFVVSGLNISPSVREIWQPVTFVTKTGESVTITVYTANDGGQTGTYTVELKINGEIVDSKEVTLGARQSEPVSFTLSGMEPGQYEVTISGLSGEFTVQRTLNWWLIGGIIVALLILLGWLVWHYRKKSWHYIRKVLPFILRGIKSRNPVSPEINSVYQR